MTNETAKRKIEMLDSYLQRKADYGESDHEAMMMAVKALEQQPCEDSISRYGVPHKIAEFFSDWDGDKNAKMEISVNDMREIASAYSKKARLEHQLKEIVEQK